MTLTTATSGMLSWAQALSPIRKSMIAYGFLMIPLLLARNTDLTLVYH